MLLLSVVRLSSTLSSLDDTSLFVVVSFWVASAFLLALAGCADSTFFSSALLAFVVELVSFAACCLFTSTLFAGTAAGWIVFAVVVATSVLFSSTLSLACALDPKKSIEPIATEAIPTVNFLIEYFIILSFLNIFFSLIFIFFFSILTK